MGTSDGEPDQAGSVQQLDARVDPGVFEWLCGTQDSVVGQERVWRQDPGPGQLAVAGCAGSGVQPAVWPTAALGGWAELDDPELVQ